MAARTATRGARGGRKATAAAPRWGFTCLICPDKPSVLVDVEEAGELGSQDQAFADAMAHLGETHEDLMNRETLPFGVYFRISLRAHAGPTVRPALTQAA